MPNDPIGMLAQQLNTAFGDLNRGLSQMNAEVLSGISTQAQMLNQMAPHNVLGTIGQGSGTFSGKMGTKELTERNIFGSGGA